MNGKYEEFVRQSGGSPLTIDRARSIDLFGHNENDDLYNRMLAKASNRAGVPVEEIERLMNIIAYHESNRTMDPSLIHERNAGRGLFGYEIGPESDEDLLYINPSGSARTAMNRLYAQAGGVLATEGSPQGKQAELPEFMKEYFSGTSPEGDVDASQLTEAEQKLLFLADHLEAGDFDGIGRQYIRSGEYGRWWGTYHKRAGKPAYNIFDQNARQYLRNEMNK